MSLADELKKAALDAQEQSRRTNLERQVLHRAKVRKNAKPLAEKIISELPEKLRKAAARGETSVSYAGDSYSHFSELENDVNYLVGEWARKQGLQHDYRGISWKSTSRSNYW